jgi:rhodanese-related sulfurtransferase
MKNFGLVGILGMALVLTAGAQEVPSITPQKAYEMVKQPATYIVDVRSVAEYYLVGHPEMAVNIPLMFWSETEARFVPNQSFMSDLKARFKTDDTLVFICRSGGRSLKAAAAAKAAGFEKSLNLAEGFEGEMDAKGYRTVAGWKNSLPYTYKIDPALAYKKR